MLQDGHDATKDPRILELHVGELRSDGDAVEMRALQLGARHGAETVEAVFLGGTPFADRAEDPLVASSSRVVVGLDHSPNPLVEVQAASEDGSNHDGSKR